MYGVHAFENTSFADLHAAFAIDISLLETLLLQITILNSVNIRTDLHRIRNYFCLCFIFYYSLHLNVFHMDVIDCSAFKLQCFMECSAF